MRNAGHPVGERSSINKKPYNHVTREINERRRGSQGIAKHRAMRIAEQRTKAAKRPSQSGSYAWRGRGYDTSSNQMADYFIVDSGASYSVCHNRAAFTHIDTNRKIVLYSGADIRTDGEGLGTIDVIVVDENGSECRIRRESVVYCSTFRVNLLSVRAEIQDYASTLSFDVHPSGNTIRLASNHKVPFIDDGRNYRLPFVATRALPTNTRPGVETIEHPLQMTYPIGFPGSTNAYAVPHVANVYAIRRLEDMGPAELVHHRMGHISMKTCAELKRHTQGLPAFTISKAQASQPQHKICFACATSKQNQLASKRLVNEKAAEAFGDVVSTDLHGPLRPSYDNNFRYLIVFVDHYTALYGVYGLQGKSASEAKEALDRFKTDTASLGSIKCLLSDGAGEYKRELQELCDEQSIQHRTSVAYYHDGNSRAERAIQHIMKGTRTMLAHARLPLVHWYKAAAYTA